MELINDPLYAVQAAVLRDALRFAGGRLVRSDGRAAIVALPDGPYKCLFADPDAFRECDAAYGLSGNACVMGLSEDAPEALGFNAPACKTYAYFKPLPPAFGGVSVKRLAPTLAELVADRYACRGEKYPADEMAELMRTHGVFGAFVDSKLAGFIGRHADGSMGMLEVFEQYRRRGIGEALESFLINYVMTFGRTPHCDVFTDNPASMRLQTKLGMTEGVGCTFWLV